MLSFHVKLVQTGRQTDRRTKVKQCAPDLSIQGHKNLSGSSHGEVEFSQLGTERVKVSLPHNHDF